LSTATGVVTVWAVGGSPSRLKEWTFVNNAWSSPVDQKWSDGTFIDPAWGIGATRGYSGGVSSAATYAAIASNPGGLVDFAKKDATTGRWTKIASWALTSTQPFANGRPGLAYQHTGGQANSVGRFYMAFNQASCTGVYGSGSPCIPQLLMTQGNLTTGTVQRLQWIKPQGFADPDPSGIGVGVALLDDISRDTNLRALSTHEYFDSGGVFHTEMWFSPVADGIVNGNLSDVNDYAYVTGALRAALGLDGGNWPYGVLPPSLP
jgi:hypothetical protein